MATDSGRDAQLKSMAEQALSKWDLAGAELELVAVRENAVFRVSAPAGRSYALRIHRPGYHDLAELNSELQWTAALSRAGIGVPAPVPTRDGRGYASVGVPGSAAEIRHVGLVEWVDGVPLQSVIERESDESARAACFEQLGRIAARIHNQAVRWPLPADFKRHSLDADGLMGEQPWWGRFWEAPQLERAERELVLKTREAVYGALNAYGEREATYSLIHADLLPAYQDREDSDALQAALVAGYRSERPLDDRDLELLPMFQLIRGLAVIGWIHQRPELELGGLIPVLIKPICARAEAFLSDR
jgi:Ser/Thr protein kinase RdoA (MazF antagonist)